MSDIKRIPEGYSHSQSVDLLLDNDILLHLLTQKNEFLWNEIQAIYTDSGLSRKYKSDSLNIWSNFEHLKSFAGYSVWRYQINDMKFNPLNLLYMDGELLLRNRGEAQSEDLGSFDKVLLYDAIATPVYEDHTEEAGSEQGTPFELMDSGEDFLYIGASEKFSSLAMAFSVFGSGYALKAEYYAETGTPGWQELMVTDDTEDLTSDGRISFEIPEDWIQCEVNEYEHYWIRISTTSIPTITAQVYSILPGDSVPALLAMSRQQIQDKEWCWCYFNNYVYMTIKNEGGGYYEGIDFIKDSSSDTNKENYFESNHHYKAIYQDVNYVPSAWAPTQFIFPVWTTETRPTEPATGMAGYNTDTGKIEVWNGEAATPYWDEH